MAGMLLACVVAPKIYPTGEIISKYVGLGQHHHHAWTKTRDNSEQISL